MAQVEVSSGRDCKNRPDREFLNRYAGQAQSDEHTLWSKSVASMECGAHTL